ncbi:S46 family peptidase [Taibaiella koreensis]|uniref:S46 family peptidase n=1 Tax=Taibaiella koreensis TaxID=1268548 RepID=UPI000E59FF76|nr:S46 family peptidase [Taibaiella koreensis]
MMKRKHQKVVLMLALAGLPAATVLAKDGMWQPAQLKRQESDMQKLGLKIPVERLYNDSGTGLNNAVVLFGKGCTGELVSANGLLFTNHHCAYGAAQELSTSEHNYLVNGFWAMSREAELPCKGLTVAIVRKMEDVTEYVLKGLADTMPENIRNARIKSRIAELEKAYHNLNGLKAEVKSFYNGNQYQAVLSEVFTDVRLVAFPPNGIGKFGADTDNWMWPRHTGDFAVFRVYAGKDNKPAPYSPGNVPYKPKAFFPINTSGYKEGDFTMVYGFPFLTQEYLSSYQLNQIQYIIDPIRIEAREKRLGVLDEAMRGNPDIFLKYAAKQSLLSNGYKKWKGEVLGLTNNDVLGKKLRYERLFDEAAAGNTDNPGDKMLLPLIQVTVSGSDNALIASEYTKETVLGVEAIQQAANLAKVLTFYRTALPADILSDSLLAIRKKMDEFYKDYDAATDHKVFDALMPLYLMQGDQVVAPRMKTLMYNSGNNPVSWGKNIFSNSIVISQDRMNELLDRAQRGDTALIKQDPAFQVYDAVASFQKEKIDPVMRQYNERIAPLNRLYMKRQMEYLNSGRAFWPDANQTLRLTYGKVERADIPGSNIYQTTLEDLIPRHNASVAEFDIPQGLRNLYQSKNYGKWTVNGTVPVDFIASNHTSGGNSGSPVLNAKGELIGINFDRIWQGTMSDLYYDPAVCRNVAVDMRYVLFIIEKYGNAGWLLKEMKLTK